MSVKRLFIDIETSPCVGSFWRPGYKVRLTNDNVEIHARIITAAYRWQGDKTVKALEWKGKGVGKQCDKHIIEEIVPLMNEADEIIAHFGDGFDVPWIRTRALFHGIVTGVWKTVDTYRWASKLFVLPTNKLNDIAQYLGIGHKLPTGYDLWRRVTFDSDVKALREMVEYNKHDVELLEQVWEKLMVYAPASTHAGAKAGEDRYTCPQCGGNPMKHIRTMVSEKGIVSHQMYCKVCPRYYNIANSVHKLWEKHGSPRGK
jgi:hypothetical protein